MLLLLLLLLILLLILSLLFLPLHGPAVAEAQRRTCQVDQQVEEISYDFGVFLTRSLKRLGS
jgi:hypothetical protein